MYRAPVRLAAVALFLRLCACDSPTGGLGIGLPDFADRPSASRLAVQLGRVYLPDGPAAEASRYVELVNVGNEAIDLGVGPAANLRIASGSGSIPLPAMLWQPNQPLQLAGAALRPLGLHRHLGELALLDAGANMQAYGAWGTEGLALAGGLADLAQQSGLATSGPARGLPFGLRDDLAVLLTPDAAAACAPADAALRPPFVAEACATRPGATGPYLSRIVPADVDDDGASIELYNPDSAAWVDPYGLTLCTTSTGCSPLIFRSSAPQTDANPHALAPGQSPATDALQAGARRRLVLRGGRSQSPNDWLSQLPPVRRNDEVVLLAPGAQNDVPPAPALFYVRLAATATTALPAATQLLQRIADPAVQGAWLAEAAAAPVRAGDAAALVVEAMGTGGIGLPSAWRVAAGGTEAPLER